MAPTGASLYRFDQQFKNSSHNHTEKFNLVGIDEAGRGPLAGPVVASAVILDPDLYESSLNDSKIISPTLREQLYKKLLSSKSKWAIGIGQVPLIDSVNILNATHIAMKTALFNLIRQNPKFKPNLVIIDGRPVPYMGYPQRSIVKGDRKSAAIAFASILAKVVRDKIMTVLEENYPQYGLAQHKGYGTEQHIENLKKFGPTPIHRKSFSPVTALSQDSRN